MSHPDSDAGCLAELASRLERDAPRWGGAPSEAARAALRARLRGLPRGARLRRRVPFLAASALIAAWLLWPHPSGRAPLRPPTAVLRAETLAVDATDRALAPLRVELAALGDDGIALARGLWRRVPGPVRVLVDRPE